MILSLRKFHKFVYLHIHLTTSNTSLKNNDFFDSKEKII